MILISSVFKNYKKPVLSNLSLEINDGTIFGLLGVNGAGKSTLLNMISGLMKPDLGSIKIDSFEAYNNVELKKKLFYLPDDPYYDRKTTPYNLIDEYKLFYCVDEKKYFEYIHYFKLPLKKTMDKFSKGMRRQAFLALALAISPKYLLLDEAFDGLDPLSRELFKKEIVSIQESKNITVIISSHSLRELAGICDTYGIIKDGKVESNGDISDALSKYHKYNLVFEMPVKQKDFSIKFKSFNGDSKFVSFVTELDYDSVVKETKDLNPLLVEEIEMDFEELFLVEVGGNNQ